MNFSKISLVGFVLSSLFFGSQASANIVDTSSAQVVSVKVAPREYVKNGTLTPPYLGVIFDKSLSGCSTNATSVYLLLDGDANDVVTEEAAARVQSLVTAALLSGKTVDVGVDTVTTDSFFSGRCKLGYITLDQ